MKLTNKQLPTFIKNIPNNIRIILLYGYDYGIIKELVGKIKLTFLGVNYNEYCITEINALSLNEDNNLLQNEIYNENLFGDNKKLVIIYNCNTTITSKIKDIINNLNEDTLIILLAEELAANNSLRVLVEKSHVAASIACYHDNNLSLQNYILSFLKENNYSIDKEALNWLTSNLGNDRLITYQELNKLLVYKGDDKRINFLDVIKVVSNNNDLVLTDLILDIFSGNHIKVYNSISQYLLNYPSLILVRGMITFLKRLIYAKSLELRNIPFNTIISKLTPPILFMHIDKFKLILAKWEFKQINIYLKHCILLELNIKKYPNLTTVLLNRFSLDIYLLLNRIAV